MCLIEQGGSQYMSDRAGRVTVGPMCLIEQEGPQYVSERAGRVTVCV